MAVSTKCLTSGCSERPVFLTTTLTSSHVIFPCFDSFFCTSLRSLERRMND
jgi:hypothetical protein